ncbi:multidrug transporter [Pasteurellaceae bacterium Orientalotternb1]|nr:multidrug transporter [Pasteurellaceae bacterium Orientalotternb1]
MTPWVLLFIAIIAEICGTTALKYSDGFTKPLPTIAALAAFGIAFYLVSIVFRTLPVGIVYAIWSGVGIVLTAVIAYFAFGQKPDFAGFIGMTMIVGGVLVINLFSKTATH